MCFFSEGWQEKEALALALHTSLLATRCIPQPWKFFICFRLFSKSVKLFFLLWMQNHFSQFFRVSSCIYIPKILEFWKPKEISRKTYEIVLNYSITAHFLFAILQKLLLNWFFIVASCWSISESCFKFFLLNASCL